MQFVIMAYDGKDEGALDRRMSVRPRHLENVARVKERGSVVCAGGLTDENGRMIGSVLVLDLPSRAALDEYLASEPYVVSGVWQDIKVETCNVVLAGDEPYAGR